MLKTKQIQEISPILEITSKKEEVIEQKVEDNALQALTDAINRLIEADSKKVFYDKELAGNLIKALSKISLVLQNDKELQDNSQIISIIEQNNKLLKDFIVLPRTTNNPLEKELINFIKNLPKEQQQPKAVKWEFDIIREPRLNLIDKVIATPKL